MASKLRVVLSLALAFLTVLAATAGSVRAQTFSVVSWGASGNAPAPPSGVDYVAVAAGGEHTVARLSDGSVVAWGSNGYGQCNVPALPSGLEYVEVAAGDYHTLARRSDGSVVAWGRNNFGQCNVPTLPSGLTYVEVAAGYGHTVARCSDGSIAAWGLNDYGQCYVPALPSGLEYVEVAGGVWHTVARRSDGSVAAWGDNSYGQCNVPSGASYVEVAAGAVCTVARRSDGLLVQWGAVNGSEPVLPPGLSYVEVAAGWSHIVARRSDGSVVAWGDNYYGQCNVPALPSGLSYIGVAAGGSQSVALTDHFCYADMDGDGYGYGIASAVAITTSCGTGFVSNDLDCDDTEATVYPGAPELCDGLDNDCAGVIDEGFVYSYCTAGTTVHGCVPSIAGIGTPSSTATSGFQIVVSQVEKQQNGIVFYGFYPTAVPWAPFSPSWRCVAPPVQRMTVLNAGGVLGQCSGVLQIDFNAWISSNPSAAGSPFTPGQVFYAQGWFRDPAAPSGTNLSNALRFALCN